MNMRVRLLLLGLVLLFTGYSYWSGRTQRNAVAELNAAERHAVYENTLQNYRIVSVNRPADAEQRYCDEQRDFLRLFTECDTGCLRLVAKDERRATR